MRDVGRVISIQCPYCDGQNILTENECSRPMLEDRNAPEIACMHCRSLFGPSEGVRIHEVREMP